MHLNILKKYYGYDKFRKNQEDIIKSILTKKSTIGIMPTGSGKSICFQIPAIILNGITIVISPLISLMKDQVDTLNELNIPAICINSSLTNGEIEVIMHELSIQKYKLLYISPERLDSSFFINKIKHLNISLITIDEAHCISQWGHDFRPSYLNIASFISIFNSKPIIAAFTATATEYVQEDIIQKLKLTDYNLFTAGLNRENLEFIVKKNINKLDFLINYLKEKTDISGIIYTSTRKEADYLSEILKIKGYENLKYHAGMNEDDRKKTQEDFYFDKKNILIATNAFGMGIDKSNIRFVIHYNIPKNLESYYQEAGRAGRDGDESECILLFESKDVITQKFLIEQSETSPLNKSSEYDKLQKVVDYCHTTSCLRKKILEYFNDHSLDRDCNNCSNCNNLLQEVDITLDAQKVISCILRMNQKFGINTVANVLKGSQLKKIISLKFNQLSTFGILRTKSIIEITNLINYLISSDFLSISTGKYPIVTVTNLGFQVIKNNTKVTMKSSTIEHSTKTQNKIDSNLYNKLKNLRLVLSQTSKLPPYMIFSDKTLQDICIKLPQTNAELLNIEGISGVKAEKYGTELLKIINSYNNLQTTSFTNKDILNTAKLLENTEISEATTTDSNSFELLPSIDWIDSIDIEEKTHEINLTLDKMKYKKLLQHINISEHEDKNLINNKIEEFFFTIIDKII